MTLEQMDHECNKLFRELDAMKAAGEDSSAQGSRYMVTLYRLRDLTAARVNNVFDSSANNPEQKGERP